MEEILFDQIQKFGDWIIWPYALTFIMLTFVINQVVKSTVILPKIQPKMQTWLRSLIIGLGLGIVFFILNGVYTQTEVLRYLVSMVFSMFVLWDGLRKYMIKKKDDIS
jgi:uncharacterized membrane protein